MPFIECNKCLCRRNQCFWIASNINKSYSTSVTAMDEKFLVMSMMVKNLVVIIGNLVDQMKVVIIPIKPLLFASHNLVKKKVCP
jgi:hypothetical protein